MWLVDRLAEERIEQAAARGELAGLPGEGRPLELDDDSMVPPELRVAYRVLRNAGYLPEEMQLRREIHDAEELLRMARTEEERAAAGTRLRLLLVRLGDRRGGTLLAEDAYFTRIRARIESG